MKPYVIRQGEHLLQIAARLGFEPDAVWAHDDNRSLREQRDSGQVLAAGDILHVPESAPTRGLSLEPGTTNRFSAAIAQTTVRLTLKTATEILRNETCIIHGLGEPQTLETDGDGLLEIAITVRTSALAVEVPSRQIRLTLRVGHLNPVHEESGMLQRLENLGYLFGLATEHYADAQPNLMSASGRRRRIADALACFQRASGLDVTGEIDDDTRDRLRDAHGG